MPYMTWNVWKRSQGCRDWMDKTTFAGTLFTNIFYDAMRIVFYDENNKPGLLPRGMVYAASQKVVVANGRRNGFTEHDQEVMLKAGIFKYNSSSWFGNDQLEFQGPEADKLHDAKNMAEAPINGEYIYLHFYNLIQMANAGTGPFQDTGPVPATADGRRMLSVATGAVVLHEVMHNHGFRHPADAIWTPGSDYASTLPHVAFRSVLDAARGDTSSGLGSSAAALLTKIRPPTCGTHDGTPGGGAPSPQPPPAPPAEHLYSAVFEKGDGRYMLRGWSQADLEKETVNKTGQGYRLSDQVRYEDVPGQPRYDAVFRPAEDQHKAVWGYDLASLQGFEANLHTKGLALLHQLSYLTAQGRQYDALFATRAGERRLCWGWTRADLVAEQRKLEPEGFYLHHQHSYDIGGGDRRYDAIFLQLTPAEKELPNEGRSILFHGITRDVVDLRLGAAAIFAASSLHHVQSYRSPDNTVRLYDIILRPGPRNWVLDRTADQLSKDESEQWNKGFRTTQVDRS